MSTQEKVARYLKDRKRVVEAKDIATYFLLSTSVITRALQRLEHEGKAVRQRFGRNTYWSWKREEAQPVAVPRATAYIQPSQPTTFNRPPPAKTSYPHIRGYED